MDTGFVARHAEKQKVRVCLAILSSPDRLYLATLGYRRLQVAPAAPENRSTRPRGFQKNCGAAVAAAIPQAAQGKPVEVWFQDEARVGQQGTLTRIWARRGTRPRAPRDTRYQWAYLFGAVCPARGVAAGLVLPTVNTEAMSAHLAEISRTIAPVRRGNDPPDHFLILLTTWRLASGK